MFCGFDYLTEYPKELTADKTHWLIHIFKNYHAATDLIMDIFNSDNLNCVICGKRSRNYQTEGSLKDHYGERGHKLPIAFFYLDYLATKTPQEIEALKSNSIHSVKGVIVAEVISN